MKKFEIKTYKWISNGYAPKTWGELKLDRSNDTLYVKMTCEEENPIGRVTYGPDAPVYKDSCMEFFFEINNCGKYINLEMNSIGGYHCGYGENKYDRTFHKVFTEEGEPKAEVQDGYWTAEAVIDLKKVYALTRQIKITSLRGNFYKCGDETPLPHFGMYSEVMSETPNFHLSKFFSKINLEEIE